MGASGMGKIGWLAAFIYVAAAALRLARFNTQVEVADKRYFQGLASPAAAAVIAGAVWVGEGFQLSGAILSWGVAILTIFAGALMVSNIRYYSFKTLDLKGKVPFVALLIMVLIFVLVSIDPPLVLWSVFVLYALSGPVLTIMLLIRHRRMREDKRRQ